MSALMDVPFVLVTGGKGGVGKTTVAANLGVDLARDGQRILLVDLDLGLANLDVVLGLSPEGRIDAALRGDIDMASCIISGPGGVDVLPAASGCEEMAALDPKQRARLIELVAGVAAIGGYDLVIGDSAAGVGSDVLGFSALADRVIVVTTPDASALTDAYGLIKALDEYGRVSGADIPTPEVLVNHASGIEEGQAVAAKLRSICERFLARSPRQAGWLPRSVSVERSGALRTPFVLRPKRALEQVCMRQIASRLQRLVRTQLTPVAAGKNF